MKLDKPAILISPSITEGLDLVDDCARFAIFAKIPFGQLTDTWIKARMDISQKWYQLRALTDVIQGGGRIVRSSDDYGVVYILDSSFKYLYSNTKQYLPSWWKEAYSEV
jgi:Rad3-related DNA helicase